MMYSERNAHEQEVITKAYDFEIRAVEECDSSRNPWFDEIMAWPDGKEVWNAIDTAVAMHYHDVTADEDF